MVFYMPGGGGPPHLEPGGPLGRQDDLTPSQVVAELDAYIIGQSEAKRAVAVALRNRWRRKQLPPEQAEEVLPKNILMIGPTGVGKTEIARRLARLVGSPFLKVEATKYTEVGYVGRDVESMIRDLLELAVEMVRRERRREVAAAAVRATEDRLLELLAGPRGAGADGREWIEAREELRGRLRGGELEERMVELEVPDEEKPAFRIAGGPGMDEMEVKLGEMLPGFMGRRTRRTRVSVREARELLQREEEDRRLDEATLAKEAIERTEQTGIVFIDEIDKVAGGGSQTGPDVSRQGVQRDLLPIVEGTIVQTKRGPVRTDHILFIAAGAFHAAKPSDLLPELQGRFPIRVELQRLTREDLYRILTVPKNALVRQYQSLLAVDGVDLTFSDASLREIAELADRVNESVEDIGARRLATILERLLGPLLFDAPDRRRGPVAIDAPEVREALSGLAARQDLARFAL